MSALVNTKGYGCSRLRQAVSRFPTSGRATSVLVDVDGSGARSAAGSRVVTTSGCACVCTPGTRSTPGASALVAVSHGRTRSVSAVASGRGTMTGTTSRTGMNDRGGCQAYDNDSGQNDEPSNKVSGPLRQGE